MGCPSTKPQSHRVPDGAEPLPVAGVAPHRPVFDHVADRLTFERGCPSATPYRTVASPERAGAQKGEPLIEKPMKTTSVWRRSTSRRCSPWQPRQRPSSIDDRPASAAPVALGPRGSETQAGGPAEPCREPASVSVPAVEDLVAMPGRRRREGRSLPEVAADARDRPVGKTSKGPGDPERRAPLDHAGEDRVSG